MPLMFYGLCRLFSVPNQITILVLTYSAMPLGLYTIIIPAATGGDETPGASMAVISNIVGLLTVPLLLSLVRKKQYSIKLRMERIREKLERVEGKLLRAYMDFADHTLDEEQCLTVKEKLLTERGNLVNEMQELQRKMEEINSAISQFHVWANRLRNNLKNTAFDEALVNELVSRVTVYDVDRIEVEFACMDAFQTDWLDELLAEPKDRAKRRRAEATGTNWSIIGNVGCG